LGSATHRTVVDAARHLVQHRHHRDADSADPRSDQGSRNAVDHDHIGVLLGPPHDGACSDDAQWEYLFTTGLEAQHGVVLTRGDGHASVVEVAAGQAVRVTESDQ